MDQCQCLTVSKGFLTNIGVQFGTKLTILFLIRLSFTLSGTDIVQYWTKGLLINSRIFTCSFCFNILCEDDQFEHQASCQVTL